jgi:hypothetical protein
MYTLAIESIEFMNKPLFKMIDYQLDSHDFIKAFVEWTNNDHDVPMSKHIFRCMITNLKKHGCSDQEIKEHKIGMLKLACHKCIPTTKYLLNMLKIRPNDYEVLYGTTLSEKMFKFTELRLKDVPYEDRRNFLQNSSLPFLKQVFDSVNIDHLMYYVHSAKQLELNTLKWLINEVITEDVAQYKYPLNVLLMEDNIQQSPLLCRNIYTFEKAFDVLAEHCIISSHQCSDDLLYDVENGVNVSCYIKKLTKHGYNLQNDVDLVKAIKNL